MEEKGEKNKKKLCRELINIGGGFVAIMNAGTMFPDWNMDMEHASFFFVIFVGLMFTRLEYGYGTHPTTKNPLFSCFQ